MHLRSLGGRAFKEHGEHFPLRPSILDGNGRPRLGGEPHSYARKHGKLVCGAGGTRTNRCHHHRTATHTHCWWIFVLSIEPHDFGNLGSVVDGFTRDPVPISVHPVRNSLGDPVGDRLIEGRAPVDQVVAEQIRPIPGS